MLYRQWGMNMQSHSYYNFTDGDKAFQFYQERLSLGFKAYGKKLKGVNTWRYRVYWW